MVDACRWEGDELCLVVRVQPRGGIDRIVGIAGDEIRVRLTAPPVEGKANRSLVKLIASEFRVPQKQVTLESGTRGRTKRLRIQSPRSLPDWLPDELSAPRTRGAGG